jgi:hypothetical protein
MKRRCGFAAAGVVVAALALAAVWPAAPDVPAALASGGRLSWSACGLGLGLMAGGAYFLPVSPLGALLAYSLGAGLASFNC